MWFVEERERSSQSKNKGLLLTTGAEHVVGRKDCAILIQDDASISRKHSVITVQHDEANLGDPSKISQVFLEDFSKYGTFINGVKISGTVNLKNGDEILFGKNNSYYRLKHTPLVVVTSCLEDKKKKTLKSHVHILGGHLINDWRPNTISHLVMDGLTFTIKVIHALAECCPIVTPSYFDDVMKIVRTNSTPPPMESYLPPLKEDTISSQGASFLPREARKTLFNGKTFIFISKKQHKRVHHAVELSGGSVLLRDTPESHTDHGLVSKDVCVMMMDSKEQNTLPAASQEWVLQVMETLRRHRCRPIPESELGLALLFMSLDKYCNPSITAVPPLTQNLVSQSFQAADIMSQRVCSQQIAAHETQFKKPSTPVKHAKDDRTEGITSEQQNTTFQKSFMKTKRCTSEDSVVESAPESQTDSEGGPPSTKRRKLVEAETSLCSEAALVPESMDLSKSVNKTQSNLQLADSIVTDSLDIMHDPTSESDDEPKRKQIRHEIRNKVENIPDSLDVTEDNHIDETKGFDEKEEKTVEHVQSEGMKTQAQHPDTSAVLTSLGNVNGKLSPRPNEYVSDIHVPEGFLCSRIPRKTSRKTVFEDVDAHLPRNLIVVDQMSLVVRRATALPTVQKTTKTTTTNNFKKFTKQLYPGSSISLPRIIGGSDLVVYQSSDRLDKDEWFLEAREVDAERQREERRAEELFRWEERPTKNRRTKR